MRINYLVVINFRKNYEELLLLLNTRSILFDKLNDVIIKILIEKPLQKKIYFACVLKNLVVFSLRFFVRVFEKSTNIKLSRIDRLKFKFRFSNIL